ncbi:Crp/Fnr family transcriptional regulator [Olivibacter sitiensis]|uniref:Crp/Fnr family transcriptional regulator n=1 Tax=Olivibacter sitiensis TaxID=376470 RepID=UPI000428B1E1|nr:Crp/Fnr family transcriptional regulator [Olivibacter sitiensis]
MFDALKKSLDHIIQLNEEEWTSIKDAFELVSVPSKHLLTDFGERESKIYFVGEGLVRLYCMNSKGEETTVFIFKEHHFASCYHSFLTQTPSDQAMETLESCTLLSISKENYSRLHREVPKMNMITRVVAEQRFINAQRIFSSHIMRTAEERYLEFERLHGDLLLRIPHHIIASYLGITPVSLSRIRNRLSKK